MKSFSAKRLLVFALAPALLMLSLDSAISHFAGKGIDRWEQLIPVISGVAGAVLLVLATGIRFSQSKLPVFRIGLRVVSVVAIVTGAAGTGFHLIPLVKDLSTSPSPCP